MVTRFGISVVTFALLLVFLGCASCNDDSPSPSPTSAKWVDVTITRADGSSLFLKAELAVTDQKRTRGLMFREHLADDEGMLFIFDKEEEHSFWMKNTKIPLDILFISKDGEIKGIVHEASPLKEDSLTVGVASKYVLEVRGGFCKDHEIRLGHHVDFDL